MGFVELEGPVGGGSCACPEGSRAGTEEWVQLEPVDRRGGFGGKNLGAGGRAGWRRTGDGAIPETEEEVIPLWYLLLTFVIDVAGLRTIPKREACTQNTSVLWLTRFISL